MIPRGLFIALGFLTRIPVPDAARRFETDELKSAIGWFPLVGALTAGLAALLDVALRQVLPAGLSAPLAVGFLVLLTGGLTEDAVADVADAFGGAVDRTARLRILKDSLIGSFGGAALVLWLLVRCQALAALAEPVEIITVWVAAGACGRWASTRLLLVGPVIGSGLGSLWAEAAGPLAHTWSALALGLVLLLVGLASVVTALGAVAVTLLLVPVGRRYFTKGLGGVTGDCVGSLGAVVELVILIGGVAVARGGC